MIIFDSNVDRFWGHRVNFVDDNNVFVGYDMDQSCCEYASWYISDDPVFTLEGDEKPEPTARVLESYVFDRDYMEDHDDGRLDEGGAVSFRLVSEGRPDLFLFLFNIHNGYYGHGFSFGIDETSGWTTKLQEGSL